MIWFGIWVISGDLWEMESDNFLYFLYNMRPYVKELEDYSPPTQHLLGCIYNMSRIIVRISFICHFISPLQNIIYTVSHKYHKPMALFKIHKINWSNNSRSAYQNLVSISIKYFFSDVRLMDFKFIIPF